MMASGWDAGGTLPGEVVQEAEGHPLAIHLCSCEPSARELSGPGQPGIHMVCGKWEK